MLKYFLYQKVSFRFILREIFSENLDTIYPNHLFLLKNKNKKIKTLSFSRYYNIFLQNILQKTL